MKKSAFSKKHSKLWEKGWLRKKSMCNILSRLWDSREQSSWFNTSLEKERSKLVMRKCFKSWGREESKNFLKNSRKKEAMLELLSCYCQNCKMESCRRLKQEAFRKRKMNHLRNGKLRLISTKKISRQFWSIWKLTLMQIQQQPTKP